MNTLNDLQLLIFCKTLHFREMPALRAGLSGARARSAAAFKNFTSWMPHFGGGDKQSTYEHL
jgi:hypothetical protein